MVFSARIQIRNSNPFVAISAARARKLKPDWRKPMPVSIRVNGAPAAAPWRINMMPAGGGDFYLYLHGDVRRESNTKVGDTVRVEIAFDAAYRGGPMQDMPAWFGGPLRRNARASAAWKLLIPSRQKEILRYLSALKSPEAQARNVARALRVLAGKRERFMARSW